MEVTVDAEPEFDLPAYEEFEYTIRSTEVSKEEVEKELDGPETKEHPSKKWIAKWRTAITLKCSYEGTLDGSPFPKFFRQTDVWKQSNT